MCECHQPIKQCRLTYKKIEEKATKECGFVLIKHEILHLLQHIQKDLERHPFPTMATTMEVNPDGT
jgi:hypothetical protein